MSTESAVKHTPESNDPPTCVKCGDEYSLRDGCEITDYCDQCAQEVAIELLEARVKLTGLVRDVHNVFRMDAAEWIVKQPIFTEAEAVVRKAKGE